MKKKLAVRVSAKRRFGAVTAIAAVAVGAYFLLSTGSGKPFPVPAYSVLRVIDGDTFVTTEKQVIRVGSTEAPEVGIVTRSVIWSCEARSRSAGLRQKPTTHSPKLLSLQSESNPI